jgi:hypothetical protein
MITKCDIKISSSEVFLLYRVQYELVTIFNIVPSQYMRVFVIWNLFIYENIAIVFRCIIHHIREIVLL